MSWSANIWIILEISVSTGKLGVARASRSAHVSELSSLEVRLKRWLAHCIVDIAEALDSRTRIQDRSLDIEGQFFR